MEIFHIENLTFSYPGAPRHALRDINLGVCRGEFILLCGSLGCGKTTLLKLLKRELSPFGKREGQVRYEGIPVGELDKRRSASEIGFVTQNPDNQIVTDKVWHELSFGLENLGFSQDVIRRRVGEMASYFGIQDWFFCDTDSLSGGQKQLLNLASVMVMQPRVLILDEPTGQLDPIAASDFIATLQKLNKELGLTIIIAEHRLEEVFPIADRVVVMDEGKILFSEAPRKIGENTEVLHARKELLWLLPSPVRIFYGLNISGRCPLTVREGRKFLEDNFKREKCPEIEDGKTLDKNTPSAIELSEVWFRYERDGGDILRGMTLSVKQGEIFCILGGNGSGKTTALNVICGISKPYRGRVSIAGKRIKEYRGNSLYKENIALLPQNPQTLFVSETVKKEFEELLEGMEVKKSRWDEEIERVTSLLDIGHLLNQHPYDLSGGEQQKCALGKVLLSNPRILLMDEPTKGLDAVFKQNFIQLLKELTGKGMTILIVTHDVEFAAEAADRCGLFFNGELLCADTPPRFFSENAYYTTYANRMARELFPRAVTCAQVVECCLKEGAR